MELLVALGDVYHAERLIPISSAHISGISYKTIGEGGLKFLREISKDARVKTKATTNPLGMDRKRWREMGISESFAKKQLEIVSLFQKMGVEDSWTCTPYLVGNRPLPGTHISWSESSAVVFANSVLGARTNREGGPSALASAIVGLTPEHGMHLERNRKATKIFEIEARMSDARFGALGVLIGKTVGDGVPYITGLRADEDNLKALGAGMGAAGSVSLFHIEGSTPEFKTALSEDVERIQVEDADIEETIEDLSDIGEPDLIAIGCPHCSLSELRSISRLVSQRKLDTELWVCSSRDVVMKARTYVSKIERIGKVFCDTCMVVCPLESISKTVATNSGKAAFYLPRFCQQRVIFAQTKEILERYS